MGETGSGTVEFEARLARMVGELGAAEGVVVYDVEVGEVAEWIQGPGHAREVIREVAGVDLEPGTVERFHRYENLSCYWRGAGEDRALGGEFALTHLVNVCVGEVPAGLSGEEWSAGVRPADGTGLRSLCCVLDVYGPEEEEKILSAFDQQGLAGIGGLTGFAEADGPGAGFATVDGAPGRPEVWHTVNTDGTLLRLDLSHPEYLEALLLTRGLFGWQYLYADPRDPGFGYCRIDLGPGLDFLERTFPADDFYPLRARWEAHLRDRPDA